MSYMGACVKGIMIFFLAIVSLRGQTTTISQEFSGPCKGQETSIESAGFEINRCENFFVGEDIGRAEIGAVLNACTCEYRKYDHLHCGDRSTKPYCYIMGRNGCLISDLNLKKIDSFMYERGLDSKVTVIGVNENGQEIKGDFYPPYDNGFGDDYKYMDGAHRRYLDINDCETDLISLSAQNFATRTERDFAKAALPAVLALNANGDTDSLLELQKRYQSLSSEVVKQSLSASKASSMQKMMSSGLISGSLSCVCQKDEGGPAEQIGIVTTGSVPEELKLSKEVMVVTSSVSSDLEKEESGRLVVNEVPEGYKKLDCGDRVTNYPGAAQGVTPTAQLFNGTCWAVGFSNLLAMSTGKGREAKTIDPSHLALQVDLYQCFSQTPDADFCKKVGGDCSSLPSLKENCLNREGYGFNTQNPCEVLNSLPEQGIKVCPDGRASPNQMKRRSGEEFFQRNYDEIVEDYKGYPFYYKNLESFFSEYNSIDDTNGDGCTDCAKSDFIQKTLGLITAPQQDVMACLAKEEEYKRMIGLMCAYSNSCEGKEINLTAEDGAGLLACQNIDGPENVDKALKTINDSLDKGLPMGITFCYSALIKKENGCPVLHSGVILGRSMTEIDGEKKPAYLLNPGFGFDLCYSLAGNPNFDSNSIGCEIVDGHYTGNIWVTEEKLKASNPDKSSNLRSTFATTTKDMQKSELYAQMTQDDPCCDPAISDCSKKDGLGWVDTPTVTSGVKTGLKTGAQ